MMYLQSRLVESYNIFCSDNKDANAGFGLDNKDVKGSLKVHIKLDLEADIRIIAKIKGDVAIGLL